MDFLPYFCKNNKFGCEEILFKDSELFEHEHDCAFQIVCCPDFCCKNEVKFLDYLDHFREKHNSYEDLGEGKTFKLPLPMEEVQSLALRISLENDVLSSNSKYQGKYEISDVVNGKPSWIMGSCAIWYYSNDKYKAWIIGSNEEKGNNMGSIYARFMASRGPDDSNNVWRYYNHTGGKSVKVGENDLIVRSLFEKGRENLYSRDESV